ncbi:MAG TPA: response regulator transcription factor [Conexibacter sp.]|jgi:DNA-binding response OmpR family regulator|nr:response regulator transcription factor [Conexibacter sp.]
MPKNGSSAQQILLVESERMLAEALARALGRAGYATTTVASGAGALALATQTHFDLVLLDSTLPDADSRELCDALHERTATPIVMLAESLIEADRGAWSDGAWSDGAEDYIVKPVRDADAVARVRGVLRRLVATSNGAASAREILRAGPLTLDTLLRRVRLDDRELRLPPKELALLTRLMREAGRAVSREALMHDVWGEDAAVSSRTLDVHVGTLRSRLGDDPDAPRFIHTVRGVGFRFSSPEELRAGGADAGLTPQANGHR